MALTTKDRRVIDTRIEWLKQKLSEMRRVDGPDYNRSVLCQGRVEGEIHGIIWLRDKLEAQS